MDEPYITEVFGSVREARAAILRLGLSSETEARVALVVSELATNAVLHAGGLLYVRIWYYNRRIRLEVADSSAALPKPRSIGTISGRGLRIVEALATAWGSQRQPGGKIVWAELD